jgi:hypothetical protein
MHHGCVAGANAGGREWRGGGRHRQAVGGQGGVRHPSVGIGGSQVASIADGVVSWGDCLGDNCQSSAQTAPVGSRQLRLGRHSVECGLVGSSRAWWNDRQNDHLSNRYGCLRPRSGSAWATPQGRSQARWLGGVGASSRFGRGPAT